MPHSLVLRQWIMRVRVAERNGLISHLHLSPWELVHIPTQSRRRRVFRHRLRHLDLVAFLAMCVSIYARPCHTSRDPTIDDFPRRFKYFRVTSLLIVTAATFTVGYALRAKGHYDYTDLNIYIGSTILVYMAP
jgi:hypothetical protein